MFWRKKGKREKVMHHLKQAGSSGKLDLRRRHLRKVDLSGLDLSGANLSGANLSGQDLSHKNLSNVNLSEANLREANLDYADLRGTMVSLEQLREALSLQGAIMPDGTKHP